MVAGPWTAPLVALSLSFARWGVATLALLWRTLGIDRRGTTQSALRCERPSQAATASLADEGVRCASRASGNAGVGQKQNDRRD